MSTTTLIILVALVVLIVAIAVRSGGPKITTIETRRETESRKTGTDA